MKTITAFLLAFTGILSAATERDWTAWQWESPIEARETGMMRLEVPPAVLDVSRPDLGDLRLLSPTGVETSYLADLPRQMTVSVRDATGFKAVLTGRSTVIEVSPESAGPIDAVELVSPAREFLKSVSLEGRNQDGEWQPLMANEVIFRQSGGAERLRIPLPAGVWANLRFTVNDDRSQPAPFTGVRLRSAAEKNPATVEFPVMLGKREEGTGETRLTLDLGARNLHVAELRFEIPDAVFSRTCTLGFSTNIPDGNSHMETLSRGILYRVIGERQVSAEEVVIPVHRRIPTRYLVATFRNGDSPPLTVTGAAARCYPSVLTFHAPQAGAWRLLSGNRGATPPDYDLNALRGTMAADGQLLAPAPLQARADFKIPPALPGVESSGASIDLTNWSRRRPLRSAPSGVIQIELDAQALAGCQNYLYLDDLGLIQNGRQIPYLIKSDHKLRELTPTMIQLPDDPKHPTISRWEFTLPVDGLPVFELTATSPTPLFSRTFEAFADRKDELGNSRTESIGTVNWTRPEGDTPFPIIGGGGSKMPRKFRVQTDHGDNPPFLIENPLVRYRARTIIAKITGSGQLFLVYGNPKATAPRYDLQLVRDELMAAEPHSVELGEKEILGPDKRENISVDAGSPWLWLALAGVIAALLVVVAKLLPRPATE